MGRRGRIQAGRGRGRSGQGGAAASPGRRNLVPASPSGGRPASARRPCRSPGTARPPRGWGENIRVSQHGGRWGGEGVWSRFSFISLWWCSSPFQTPMHSKLNFPPLQGPWREPRPRTSSQSLLAAGQSLGAWPAVGVRVRFRPSHLCDPRASDLLSPGLRVLVCKVARMAEL